MESLADFLGIAAGAQEGPDQAQYESLTAKEFAEAVLSSPEFRRYVVNSLAFGSLPAAVITRLMDYAWGKPADRVEHTGKDGAPIETITEVRRVIIRVEAPEEAPDEVEAASYTRH